MNALFSSRRGFPRSLLCSFMLPALAAYAGSARALECGGVVRPEEILERIGPPETAPGPFFVVRRTCHPSVRRIFPDHPLRCILLPASFPGAPEAFPFSLGKFLLWPVPAKKN